MKRLVLIASLALVAFCCHAQQGEIIYSDFEPDSLVELKQYDLYPECRMDIDFDFDNFPDIRIFSYFSSGVVGYEIRSYEPEWELHEYEAGDTLIPMNEPEQWWSTGILWMPYFYHDIDTMSDRFAVRHRIGDVYYYGWFRIYLTPNPPSLYWWVALDKMAYCTIPDYPLLWGQTSLTENIEETESSTFTNIYPNPTTGIVTVTGENLRQVEVFNMLGQQVFSIKGEGNELRIDMAELPAGVYFVNVTDEEGRRCVRKVVKE